MGVSCNLCSIFGKESGAKLWSICAYADGAQYLRWCNYLWPRWVVQSMFNLYCRQWCTQKTNLCTIIYNYAPRLVQSFITVSDVHHASCRPTRCVYRRLNPMHHTLFIGNPWMIRTTGYLWMGTGWAVKWTIICAICVVLCTSLDHFRATCVVTGHSV